jgi:hypothetical protein
MLHPPTRRTTQWLAALGLLGAILAGPGTAAVSERFDLFVLKLAPVPSDLAVDRIPDPGRKLLALRSYLRAGKALAERWSWTDDEIEAFQGSIQQAVLQVEINAVRSHFATANPGYELYIHSQIRSLDEQIDHWNRNASVKIAADELLAAWTAAFGPDAGENPSIDHDKARAWLRAAPVANRPSIAAPGLTLHGRAQAIDFQVMKDGVIVAGADTSKIETVWRAQKWDEKLKASIDAASPSFHGPLKSPDEPWHYDFVPPPPVKSADKGSR